MSSFQWPPIGGGSASWKDSVGSAASLPASGTIGEVRLTLDTKNLYEWNGSAWVLILNATATVTGPGSSVDQEVALFNGTSGTVIKRATGTGVAHLTAGVLSASSVVLTSEVSGVLPVANGGTNSSTALNNNRVVQSSGGKLVEAAAITGSRALVSDVNGIPAASTVTSTELGYVSGVTSALQTQLNSKQGTGNYITALTGDVSASGPGSVAATISGLALSKLAALTISKALVSDASGVISASSVSSTTLGFLDATSSVQTQLDAKAIGVASAVDGEAVLFSGTGGKQVKRATGSGAAVLTSGVLSASATTATELGYVSGVTSSIQTQFNNIIGSNAIIAVSSNVTLTNKAIHLVDTSLARTLTLPSPASGVNIIIKDKTGSASTNPITLARAGTEKIETVAASYSLNSDLGSWRVISDGTDWFIV